MEKEELHKNLTSILKQHEHLEPPIDTSSIFNKHAHFFFLSNFLHNHKIYSFFDVQKPWLVYWGLNSLLALQKSEAVSLQDRLFLADFILDFQSPEGGFCGGKGYPPNMATTYASVLALAALDLPQVYGQIDRPAMRKFLLSCRAERPGAFRVHRLGEVDLRCTFIAILVGASLGILDEEITRGVVDYIVECQGFDGGISPLPEVEAHGGYTFCGVAALALLGQLERLNLRRLTYWLANQQTEYGGFCGRTSKLVDSCYSFWQGTSFHIIQEYFSGKQTLKIKGIFSSEDKQKAEMNLEGKEKRTVGYNTGLLQKYLLFCCQEKEGGMRDKPGKKVDIYHTMYALSGLALSSHASKVESEPIFDWSSCSLEDMDPIFNIPRKLSRNFISHFSKE